MKRKASIPHDETIIRRLRKDPDFAADTSKRHWKMKTSPAFCSLPCATSLKPRASPKSQRLPASSVKVFTGLCRCTATPACPCLLSSPRLLG